jgi:hypothetical protein
MVLVFNLTNLSSPRSNWGSTRVINIIIDNNISNQQLLLAYFHTVPGVALIPTE